MSPPSEPHPFIGPWINWSHGRIVGATLTLTERNGDLLTAFLAIFVAAAGAALWRIISYMVHQFRANPEPSDGLHHQQQVILRNVSSPGDAAWSFFTLPFYWWKHAQKPIARSWPLVIFALLNWVLFFLAGIFSAEVTKVAGNGTLIRSPSCGQWTADNMANRQTLYSYMAKDLSDTITAASYARDCYGNTASLPQCSRYAQQQISWTTNHNVSCPFASGLCLGGDTSAYQMDTEAIDSHVVLGINAPVADRITYRRVTTCSPINTESYVQVHNNTDVDSDALDYGDRLIQFDFGEILGVSNFTYEYDTHGIVSDAGYMLTSYFAQGGADDNTWWAVPALNQTTADLAIFFLAPNDISYLAPVDDPFFSAHVESSIPNPSDNGATNLTFWLKDEYVNAMACSDQHQYCNPVNSECTPLTSSTLANAAYPSIGLTAIQLATANRLSNIIFSTNIYNSVEGRGSLALQAANTVFDHWQSPLPNNQWQIEVSNWLAVSLAKLQDLVVQYATGPPAVVTGAHIEKPATDIEQAMCDNQVVRSSTSTVSFSVLGVSVILIAGTLLVIINTVLDVIVGAIQKRFDLGEQRRLKWVLDDKFQLQRLAYEEVGMGRWIGGAEAVPVTSFGDKWAIPEGVDSEHPRLKRGNGGIVSGGGEMWGFHNGASPRGYEGSAMGGYVGGEHGAGYARSGSGQWGGTDGKGTGWDDRSSVTSGLLSPQGYDGKAGYTVEAVDLGFN